MSIKTVFVSYSSNDKVKVTRLVRAIESAGIKVWFDEDQIFPGDDFIEKMRVGVNECTYYLLCLSPSFDKKPPQSWVKHEFRMAMLKENKEAENCIIPVRIKSGGGIPAEIGGRAYADLSTTKRWGSNFDKLVSVLKRKKA
jgi:hypothetical protein